MTNIQKFTLLLLLVIFAAMGRVDSVAAQAANPKAEMVLTASEVDSAITLLLPAVQKVREAAARKVLYDYLTRCQTISKNVIRAGIRMSDAQYKQFKQDFINANNSVSSDCKSPTTELQRHVCECIAGGHGGPELTKCIVDKQGG